MSYKTVCVAGGGVLGSQIAFQAAYCGFDVTIWLRSEGSIGRTQPKIDHVREEYIAAIEGMADGTGEWCSGIADSGKPFDKEAALAAVERAYSTLKLELDLAKAVADADLVIESMAEDTQAKIDFYKKLAPVLPQKTVVVTNSSTLLPSTFAKYTGRPEKYLSLHFAISIWKNNMTRPTSATSMNSSTLPTTSVCWRCPSTRKRTVICSTPCWYRGCFRALICTSRA